MRVGSAPGFAVPTLLRVDVGVVPPTTAPHRVANRKPTVEVILMHRAARHLRVVRRLGNVRSPIFFALGRDPFVDQGVRVLAFVDKMREPDVVIETGRLPGHALRIDADGLGDLAIVIMPVTQTAHLDAGLARHERATIKHRVARLNEPGIGTNLFHVLHHIEHELQLMVRAKLSAGVIVPVFVCRALTHICFDDVTQDIGGVEDKISALQRCLPIHRFVERQRRAELLGIA